MNLVVAVFTSTKTLKHYDTFIYYADDMTLVADTIGRLQK